MRFAGREYALVGDGAGIWIPPTILQDTQIIRLVDAQIANVLFKVAISAVEKTNACLRRASLPNCRKIEGPGGSKWHCQGA